MAQLKGGTYVGGDLIVATDLFANTLKSYVATGTAPLVLNSSTFVPKLNVNYINNQDSSFYLNASNFNAGTLSSGRGITSGSASLSFVGYNGTTALAGQFDGGTTTPTGTTRLNYGGYFYPTFLNLVGSGDTATAATHYFVETGTDGYVRPKLLADVKTEIVTKPAVEAVLTGSISTHTHADATTTVSGFMPFADKVKLNGLMTSAVAVTAATAGWYRIATSIVDVTRNSARFEIDWSYSGVHGQVTINAGIMYNQDPTLNQIHYSHYNVGITKIRLVYHTSYSGNYAYLEYYSSLSSSATVTVQMFSSLGWSLVAPNTAGSIPGGYTSQELTFVDGIATEGIFSSEVATGIAPIQVVSTTPVTNLSIGGNAATSTNATNAANVTTQTATSNGNYAMLMVGSSTPGNQIPYESANILFNPVQHILTVGVVNASTWGAHNGSVGNTTPSTIAATTVISPKFSTARGSNVTSGYNFYDNTINAWQIYMANAGVAGQGYNGNFTPPAGSLVTTWGMRFNVEPVVGYGWIWETTPNASTGVRVVAELASATGNFRTIGNINASTFSSSVTTGTAPLTVNSSTLVANLNADLLDGYNVSESASLSTIVARNSSGYILGSYFNSSRANEDSTVATSYLFDSGDGYMRKKSLPVVKTEIVTSAAVVAGLGFTPPNDTLVVHLAGTETISGLKTFSNNVAISLGGGAHSLLSILGGGIERLSVGYSYTDVLTSTNTAKIWSNTAGDIDIFARQDVASKIAFYTSAATSSIERMRITPAGNVGFGTSVPLALIDASGGIKTSNGTNGCEMKYNNTSKTLDFIFS